MLGFVNFLETAENKMQLKKIVQPIGTMIYNEIYIYLWIICFYNVFLLFILIANLIYVIHLYRASSVPVVVHHYGVQ